MMEENSLLVSLPVLSPTRRVKCQFDRWHWHVNRSISHCTERLSHTVTSEVTLHLPRSLQLLEEKVSLRINFLIFIAKYKLISNCLSFIIATERIKNFSKASKCYCSLISSHHCSRRRKYRDVWSDSRPPLDFSRCHSSQRLSHTRVKRGSQLETRTEDRHRLNRLWRGNMLRLSFI